jgi:ABC-2 type transport system permease protein
MTARVLPRAALMVATAGLLLPLLGFAQWGLRLPQSLTAAGLFAASISATLLLSAALRCLLTILIVATMTDRGANTLSSPIVNVLSGSIIPLAFFPDWMLPALRLQPLAGLADTPFRIYFGGLAGSDALAAIGLQLLWTLFLAGLGRLWLETAMVRLQVQGG